VRRPVIFLHIPKTAGQSVHAFMEASFPKEEVCPARENVQLLGMSVPRLRGYRLFSGHLDWAQLDCVGGAPFIFTILRDPLDRIMSFYFFLRRQAQGLTLEELHSPQRRGMRAALELSPDEYFCGGPPDLRHFLDDHFDNFYAFYFAGRTYDARRRIFGRVGTGPGMLSMQQVVDCAKENLRTLGGVYRVDELARLEADLRALGVGLPGRSLVEIRANTGEGDTESRLAQLAKIGPAERALRRIREMTAWDQAIWSDAALFGG
jgi:hypothetical protein